MKKIYRCLKNIVNKEFMKISVIVATYNSNSTISNTLDSILSQTYSDYEVVVKDGGSTDGTIDTLRYYSNKFEGKLKLLCCKDSGIYDAMNQAISASNGDVIGFLNSDDFFTSCRVLSTIAQKFSSNDKLDAVYADVHYVDSRDLTRVVRYYSSRLFTPEKIRAGYMPAHPTFYAKKSCYEKFGVFDPSYKVAGDFDIISRFIYINGIKTEYIPEDFVTMRTGGVSSSGFKSYLTIVREHSASMKKNGIRMFYWGYICRYIKKIAEFK